MTKRIACKCESFYDYYVDAQSTPHVLVIRDLAINNEPYKSVTNNLDAVLSEIGRNAAKELPVMPIVYRDSQLHYDGVVRLGGTLMVINLIPGKHTTDENVALCVIRDFHKQCATQLIQKDEE